ncbi:MAG: glycosyltransferase family 2 protein [Thermoanaerobaculia bacterium]|nr:glycosyltransferase family 2 protein [Thermoanaerobaculia bacterium]
MADRLSGDASLVSVVLVTWNSAPYLPRCLDGVLGQTHAAIQLIVVDNASTDDSVAVVQIQAPRARMIRNDSNRGFSAAVNQAIAVARGEFVQLANPDAFLEPEYVARLVAGLEHAGPKYGAATGKLLKADGFEIVPTKRLDSRGIAMTRSGRHFDIGQGDPDGGPTANIEIFGVSGAAALYRMAFLTDVAIDGEIFDEDFFAFREDADLAWRGRLFGWRGLYVPAAVGYHVRQVTPEKRRSISPEINMHSVKNRFLLRMKNEGLHLAWKNAPWETLRDLLVLAASLTIERTSFPAFVWLLRNRKRVLAKRRAIQKRRVVSDRELARWFR